MSLLLRYFLLATLRSIACFSPSTLFCLHLSGISHIRATAIQLKAAHK